MYDIASSVGIFINKLFSVKFIYILHYDNFMAIAGFNGGKNSVLISAREKLAVCDVTNLPYMDINWKYISIYGYFVTSLTAY